MTDRKAVIKNADMSEDMQTDAVECATQALEKYNIEKDIAAFIKKEFDKKYRYLEFLRKFFPKLLFSKFWIFWKISIFHRNFGFWGFWLFWKNCVFYVYLFIFSAQPGTALLAATLAVTLPTRPSTLSIFIWDRYVFWSFGQFSTTSGLFLLNFQVAILLFKSG